MVEHCTINATTGNPNRPARPAGGYWQEHLTLCRWHCSVNSLFLPGLSPAILMRYIKAFKKRGVALATSNTKGLSKSSWLRSIPSALLCSVLPNAFAAGNFRRVAQLSRIVTNLELSRDWALAHEMTHLQHNDVSVMLLSSIVGRLIQWLAWSGIA